MTFQHACRVLLAIALLAAVSLLASCTHLSLRDVPTSDRVRVEIA